jgi:hypothetical protein
MKKILTILTVLLASLFLASCIELEENLLGISIDWEPQQTYFLDEIVDLESLNINIVAEFQSQTVTISLDNEEVSVYGSGVMVDDQGNIFLKTSELGTFTVTFAYKGKITTVTFTTVISPEAVTAAVETAETLLVVFVEELADDAGKANLTWITLFTVVDAYSSATALVNQLETSPLQTELIARLNAITAVFQSVTALDFSDKTIPVNNLSRIGTFVSLQTLNISNVGIHDFWAFPNLPNLQTLIATDNSVPDLNLLPVLPNLKHLDVSNNNIIDVNGLRVGVTPKFQNLETFIVSNNLITDFEGMRSQAKLETLIASNANRLRAGNFDALFSYANLQSLVTLDVSHNELAKLDFLSAGYANLEYLDVSSNQLEVLNGIEHAVALEYLDASNNVFVEGGLQNLVFTVNLTYLDVSFTEVELPELTYEIEVFVNQPS